MLNSNTHPLQDFAFHRELVAARRMARREGLAFDIALEQVLVIAAGEAGLENLLTARRNQINLLAENKQKKRQLAQQKHTTKQLQKLVPTLSWCAWFDGSARPNPGACAIGVVLRAPDGREWQMSDQIGYGNSSEAEYRALIALLNLAVMQNAHDLVIYGDSKVVIDDLTLQNMEPSISLESLRQQAKFLLQKISGTSLRWVPRARNQMADSLCQAAFKKEMISVVPLE